MTLERFDEDVTDCWALRIPAVVLRGAIPQVLTSGRTLFHYRVETGLAAALAGECGPQPDRGSGRPGWW